MAEITVKELIVDGITLPCPAVKGLSISYEPVWSKNTGRTAAKAKMMGTVIAVKAKISIKWPAISFADAAIIRSVMSNVAKSFRMLDYVDIDGNRASIEAYFGPPVFNVYSYAPGIEVVESASVEAVER